ncbi:hypothetical protein VP01_1931g4 [Puccinia sorghi]|uniref:Uncharacterized protein n=1 Tax=Puccinia sorghi TaxID=27349 RepID=A0A0L6VCZ3_9BASI|nr:hypothetical protein VP01_1931g4 [Puccinia sorghi]
MIQAGYWMSCLRLLDVSYSPGLITRFRAAANQHSWVLFTNSKVEKVKEYNRNLQNITQYSQINPRKQVLISTCWKIFAKGHTGLKCMKEDFHLTNTDQDTIETLIRLTVEAKLSALTGSVTLVNKRNHGDEEIQWSTDILQAGFNAEYKRYNLIVTPTVETLRRFAGEWCCNKFKAPYTSIIGPKMTGKTRLLIEFAKHIPAVYVCLRPLRSTGHPPFSGLASEFLPLVLLAIDKDRNLLEPIGKKEAIPYFRLLCRVLSTIPAQAGFFSVVTDTNLQVENFSPALHDRDPSLRYYGSGRELFAPIFNISSIDLYGSPFYGLYFNEALNNNHSKNAIVQKVGMISQAKLLCKATLPLPCDLKNPQFFALLGSVIQTRLCSYLPINSELFLSHAVHCLFIDSSWEVIVSNYPPHFVYASAANVFLASDNACWIKCINVLASAVPKGLVALRDPGEMATRIILIVQLWSHMDIRFNCTFETRAALFQPLFPDLLHAQCNQLYEFFVLRPCGSISKQHHLLRSPNKNSNSYAQIRDLQNPYLILLFSLRTSPRVKVPEWTNPQDSSDTCRVSYQFLGLDQVDCLTPDIRTTLERLITAVPEDLLKLHDDEDQVTENWVKQLSPVFYEMSD